MERKIDVLGCTLWTDRLYRVEPYRMLFQWVKDEGNGIYSVGMASILAALAYPLYSIKIKPVGTKLEYDEALAIIEAGKRVATFPTPLSGIVVDVNEEVIKNPELINKKPYSSWIAKLKATNLEEVKNLQSAKEIVKTVKDFIILEDVDCSIVEE
ncbi:glycine cleavage system protein H [Aquifex aeolicus]|uniref:glycine cleavage system protein H n=1 Tax=Aquifex aeolicus TaxID=63363 RepID=UPI0013EEEA7C|nr:glycine cleavage system protein H [Aquifex aeolicus]